MLYSSILICKQNSNGKIPHLKKFMVKYNVFMPYLAWKSYLFVNCDRASKNRAYLHIKFV